MRNDGWFGVKDIVFERFLKKHYNKDLGKNHILNNHIKKDNINTFVEEFGIKYFIFRDVKGETNDITLIVYNIKSPNADLLKKEVELRLKELKRNSPQLFMFNNSPDVLMNIDGGKEMSTALATVDEQKTVIDIVSELYNDEFDVDDLISNADNLSTDISKLETLDIVSQNINSKIVNFGKDKQNDNTENINKLKKLDGYVRYLFGTRRLKQNSEKQYTLKTFEAWKWNASKNDDALNVEINKVADALERLKDEYEKTSPSKQGGIEFKSILSKATKQLNGKAVKTDSSDDTKGPKNCTQPMWDVFLAYAGGRRLIIDVDKLGSTTIETDGSEINLNKNKIVKQFILDNHKKSGYKKEIDRAAQRGAI